MDYCYTQKRNTGLGAKSKKRIRVLAIVLALIGLLLAHYFILAVPIVRQVSEERIRGNAMLALEDAALHAFNTNVSHSDLVEISRDGEGNITLMQANTMLIQSLIRTAIARAHDNLDDVAAEGVHVPLGAFMGATFLAGYGPSMRFRVLNIGVASTHLHSDFVSAGINQTQHSITLTLRADVTIIMPGLQSRVHVTIPVPIVESTIIGRVPDVVLQNDLFGRVLNLSP